MVGEDTSGLSLKVSAAQAEALRALKCSLEERFEAEAAEAARSAASTALAVAHKDHDEAQQLLRGALEETSERKLQAVCTALQGEVDAMQEQLEEAVEFERKQSAKALSEAAEKAVADKASALSAVRTQSRRELSLIHI